MMNNTKFIKGVVTIYELCFMKKTSTWNYD